VLNGPVLQGPVLNGAKAGAVVGQPVAVTLPNGATITVR
jgi:hypothetical protein